MTGRKTAGDSDLAEADRYSSQTDGTLLFEVSQGGGLGLTQLKLSRGNPVLGGGAILSESDNLTLDNCTIDGDVVTAGKCGAVWFEGGSVTIVGSIMGNTGTDYGGAMHAAEGKVMIQAGSRSQRNTTITGSEMFRGLSGERPESMAVVVCSVTDAELVSSNATPVSNDWSLIRRTSIEVKWLSPWNLDILMFHKMMAMEPLCSCWRVPTQLLLC